MKAPGFALVFLAACAGWPAAAGRAYYLDPAGDDAAAGTSPEAAWRSVGRANRHAFAAGDRLLLKRGGAWDGGLRLPGTGLTIGSYGSGPRPRVNGGETHALTANGPASGWTISDLELTSTNARNPARRITGGTCGIFLGQEEPCESLVIRDCLIHDTSGPGIYLLARKDSGVVFRNVTIERCEVYNASCGVQFHTGPRMRPDAFQAFRISRVVVHDIGGDGIVPFCGTDGLVEHCVAYRTGLGVSPKDHSPVAIWFAANTRCTIQYCEAYDNRDGGRGGDGGGFDLDGGCTDCVLQYNYSHDNQGAGFLICSWDPEEFPNRGSVCRYNLSINDGLANGYGGLQFWQAERAQVYNNTVVTRRAPAVKFASDPIGGSFGEIANNIFVIDAAEDIPLLESDFPLAETAFRNNVHFRRSGSFRARVRGRDYAMPGGDRFADPLFVDLARANVRLRPGSPCATAADGKTGDRDFYGKGAAAPFIGCAR